VLNGKYSSSNSTQQTERGGREREREREGGGARERERMLART